MESLVVESGHRRHGLASGLVNAVCEWAMSKNCEKLWWDTNDYMKDALSFYEFLGAENLKGVTGVKMFGKSYDAAKDEKAWKVNNRKLYGLDGIN